MQVSFISGQLALVLLGGGLVSVPFMQHVFLMFSDKTPSQKNNTSIFSSELLTSLMMCCWCVSVVSVYPDHDVRLGHVHSQHHHPGRRDCVGLLDRRCRGCCGKCSSSIVSFSITWRKISYGMRSKAHVVEFKSHWL